jgi:hypothetical protein
MEQSTSARSKEDIALDLLKFVAGHSNIAKGVSSTTPGFGGASSAKSDDPVAALLDLYSRCREAVEAPLKK